MVLFVSFPGVSLESGGAKNPFCDASGSLPQIAAGVKRFSRDNCLTREVQSYQRVTRADNRRGGFCAKLRGQIGGASRTLGLWTRRSNPVGCIGSVCLNGRQQRPIAAQRYSR